MYGTIKRVEERCLAKRSGAFGGGVAKVVSRLGATEEIISICLVGLRESSVRVNHVYEKRPSHNTRRISKVLRS